QLHEGEIGRGDDEAEREGQRGERRMDVVKLEGREVVRRPEEDTQPAREKENADGPEVVPVLGRQPAPQCLSGPEMVQPGIPLDGPRDLEARRTKQADPLTDRAIQRDQHFRCEQDVVAGPATGRVRDVVPHEVVRNDVLETSSFTRISPSATIVSLPTALRAGCAWFTSMPKFDPVCTTGDRWYPSACR